MAEIRPEVFVIHGKPFLNNYAASRDIGLRLCGSLSDITAEAPVALLAHADMAEEIDNFVPQALANPDLVALLRTRAVLVMDGSGEGPGFSPGVFGRLHQNLAQAGLDPRRVLFLTQNLEYRHAYVNWCLRNGVAARVNIREFHFHMRGFVAASQGILAAASAMTQEKLRTSPADASPSRRFVCFNNKVRQHRLVVLGRLARTGLLDRGHVSLLGGFDSNPNFQVGNVIEAVAEQFPQFADDAAAFGTLTPRMPMRIEGDDPGKGLDFGAQMPVYRDTWLSLVNETDMTDGVIRRFTEKTLKPLAYGHPAIFVGCPGALRILRSYGFRTFAPFIDEAYDEIANPEERLRMALDEFERLMALPEPELQRIVRNLWEVLLHNIDNFSARLPDMLRAEDRNLVWLIGALGQGQ